ncbi:WD40 repeat domain-containing protein [Rubripirellula reticaptiva]|nr:hypothetical protein [Rubripirellula reticaptiva]
MKSSVVVVAILAALFWAPENQAYCEDAVSDVDGAWVTSMARVGDSDKFVASTASGLLLRPADVVSFEASDPAVLMTLYSHPAAVWRVVATGDGQTVASVDYRGNLMTFNTEGGEAKTFEKAFERWCQALVLMPDQKSVIAGNEGGKVFLWNLADAKVAKSVELDGHAVTGLAVSPDGAMAAACDGGGHVHLLKLPELEAVGKIEFGTEPAWCVAMIDDGKKLVVGSGDRNLYQCEAVADAKSEVIAKGTDWITQIAVSPAGQIAASEVGGRLHFPASDSMDAPSGVWSLAWNGDGQLLVGTRKSGVVAAGRSWSWSKPKPKPAAAPETTKPAGSQEGKVDDETPPQDGSTDE